jgi:hypothetical protein
MFNVMTRTEAQSATMNAEQKIAIRALATDLERLNTAVMRAVEAGLSVELHRAARHHCGSGFWGDLLTPRVTKQG